MPRWRIAVWISAQPRGGAQPAIISVRNRLTGPDTMLLKFRTSAITGVLCAGFTLYACAADKAGGADSLSKWIGAYDSVSGKCGGLVVQESKITWGSCKQADAKLISVSASELLMQIDPSAAQCGWAGLIVALEDESGGKKPALSISAYTSLDDYKAANRYVQCSYFKKEK